VMNLDKVDYLKYLNGRAISMTDHAWAVFENYKIRRYYDEKAETWYFSVVDVVAALTDSVNPRDYWFKMKIRIKSDDGL